ncbi:MAG TPA: GlxA family transcriptional regulator [Steroidobacteraceae bacterium]
MLAKHAREPICMAFLLVPQFSMMGFSAAIEPLRSANRMGERQLFEWRLVSVDGQAVVASNGIPIAVHESLEKLSKVDMLVVCAGMDPVQFERTHSVHHHLRRLARHGAMVGAISSGSFILAEARLLTHRRCTVHWEYLDLFRSRYPLLAVTQDLYVVDRDVFTCSGGIAALDMMLHFISEACGAQLALAVAEQFIHPHIREHQDHQRLEMHRRYGIDSPKLVQIIALMEGAIEDPVDVADIAKRVGISARQVERLFRDQIGTSPRAFYLQLRLAKAKTLLRQTLSPVRTVAVECGFVSTSHFCHAYKRVFGLAPTQERQRSARNADSRSGRGSQRTVTRAGSRN